jgi:hypothetical protein
VLGSSVLIGRQTRETFTEQCAAYWNKPSEIFSMKGENAPKLVIQSNIIALTDKNVSS